MDFSRLPDWLLLAVLLATSGVASLAVWRLTSRIRHFRQRTLGIDVEF